MGGGGGFGGGGDDFNSDPRFAGKFGSNSGGGGGGSGSNAPLPTLGPTPEELAAIEEAKVAKAAKAAERAETERKAKEAKEAAKEAERVAQEEAKAAAVVASGAAGEAYGTGLKGDALVAYLKGMAVKPTGAALVSAVMSKLEDASNLKWCGIAEYGAAIKSLVGDNAKAQAAALHAIQAHLNSLPAKFPKMETKGKTRAVIEVLFQLLYANEVVDPAGFHEWADDDDDSNGKLTAVVQTTSFLQFLREADEDGGEGEEGDDDEIDAPREHL